MTHPDGQLLIQPLKEPRLVANIKNSLSKLLLLAVLNLGLAVMYLGLVVLYLGLVATYIPSTREANFLQSIADAKNRYSKVIYCLVNMWRPGFINAIWTTGKNHSWTYYSGLPIIN
jgi:hypothetical protein